MCEYFKLCPLVMKADAVLAAFWKDLTLLWQSNIDPEVNSTFC